jgi:hypothetical protein
VEIQDEIAMQQLKLLHATIERGRFLAIYNASGAIEDHDVTDRATLNRKRHVY